MATTAIKPDHIISPQALCFACELLGPSAETTRCFRCHRTICDDCAIGAKRQAAEKRDRYPEFCPACHKVSVCHVCNTYAPGGEECTLCGKYACGQCLGEMAIKGRVYTACVMCKENSDAARRCEKARMCGVD